MTRPLRLGSAKARVPDAAGAAQALALVGEFNAWDPKPEHWATKNDFGVWGLFLPDGPDGASVIPHG